MKRIIIAIIIIFSAAITKAVDVKDYKPTRYIFDGDIDKAKTIVGDGNRLLFQLKNIQQAGAPDIKHLENKYSDGVIVMADTSIYGIDLVKIFVPIFGGEKEETKEIPVPIIVLYDSEDVDLNTILGGYVAENFIGMPKRFVAINDKDKIESSDVKEIEAVGNDDGYNYSYRQTLSYTVVTTKLPTPYNDDYEPTPENTCPEDYQMIYQDCAEAPMSMVIYPPGEDASGALLHYYDGFPVDYSGYGSITRNGSPVTHRRYWICYDPNTGTYGDIIYNSFGLGSAGSNISDWSYNGTCESQDYSKIDIDGLPLIEKFHNTNSSASFSGNILDSSFSFSSHNIEDGGFISYLAHSIWDTDNNKYYMVIYYEDDLTRDISASLSGISQDYVSDAAGWVTPSFCGQSSNPEDQIHNEYIKIKTDTDEYTVYEKGFDTNEIQINSQACQIFNYNGKPFYVYTIFISLWPYDWDSDEPLENKAIYGCIYNGKHHNITYDADWYYNYTKMNSPVEYDESTDKIPEMPKNVQDKIGRPGWYNISTPISSSIRAGKYTVTKKSSK